MFFSAAAPFTFFAIHSNFILIANLISYVQHFGIIYIFRISFAMMILFKIWRNSMRRNMKWKISDNESYLYSLERVACA